jgi:hypothetical protein
MVAQSLTAHGILPRITHRYSLYITDTLSVLLMQCFKKCFNDCVVITTLSYFIHMSLLLIHHILAFCGHSEVYRIFYSPHTIKWDIGNTTTPKSAYRKLELWRHFHREERHQHNHGSLNHYTETPTTEPRFTISISWITLDFDRIA